MQMARAAGMPVPKVLSCGEHPHVPYNRFWSILMTRLPGVPLENSYDPLLIESEEPRLWELKTFVVQQLACFDPPSVVVKAVKAEFGETVTPQQVTKLFPSEMLEILWGIELRNSRLSPASRR